MTEWILRATCPAQSGIVAAVTGYLSEQDCYISALEQFDNQDTERFFMRAVFRPEDDRVDINRIVAGLENVTQKLGMDASVHPSGHPTKTLIMASRYDHCLADLLYRWQKRDLLIDPVAVVSNHQDVRAMTEREGIRFVHLPVDAGSKEQQEARLLEMIEETGAELIVLARYMQILSPALTAKLDGRCINIHHSFLPGFKGARPYHQAYERGVKLIGATAHYVTSHLDEGPIIEQMVTPVNHHHSPTELTKIGRDIESRVLSRAVRLHTERRVFLDGNKTVVFQST